jgi:hypothetical protein
LLVRQVLSQLSYAPEFALEGLSEAVSLSDVDIILRIPPFVKHFFDLF